MESQLLRINEAAQLAGVGRTAAYDYVMTGTWPSLKLGRSLRVPRSGLMAWIETCEQQAAERARSLRGEGG